MADENNEEQKTGNAFKSIKDITFFIGIYLVFSGWIYIYYYLHYFGITLKDADIDYIQFVVHSYGVLEYYSKYPWFWIMIVLLGILNYLLLHKFDKIDEKKKMFIYVTVMCSIFPIIFALSRRAGTQTAKQRRYDFTLHLVQFNFTEDFLKLKSPKYKNIKIKPDSTGTKNDWLFYYNDKRRLNLLLSNGERTFAVCYDEDTIILPTVFCIKNEHIDFSRITFQENSGL